MNKYFSLLATCAIFLVLTSGVAAQKNKGQTPVNLSVTIVDQDGLGNLYAVRSDGLGAYVNGQDGISAQFLSTGVLDFRSGNRNVSAFYSAPVDATIYPLPASDTATGVQILTFVDSTYLQLMPVGSWQCKPLAVNFKIDNYNRTIGYRAGRGTITSTGPTIFAHPDSDTWTVESDTGGVCSGFDNVARVRDAPSTGKPGDIDHGRYTMPMKLVLTRQP